MDLALSTGDLTAVGGKKEAKAGAKKKYSSLSAINPNMVAMQPLEPLDKQKDNDKKSGGRVGGGGDKSGGGKRDTNDRLATEKDKGKYDEKKDKKDKKSGCTIL